MKCFLREDLSIKERGRGRKQRERKQRLDGQVMFAADSREYIPKHN